MVDLTYDIEEDMIKFGAPWHPGTSVTKLGTIKSEGRETRKIQFGTHAGTHVDAPRHFVEGGKSIDDIPLEKLMGIVTLVDYSHLKQNEAVTKEMLQEISLTKRMLFKFGWGKYWNTPKFYINHPYFTKDAAEYLISSGVELLAIDTPSPDNSPTELTEDILGTEADSPIHKIFLSNEVILVEYIANLGEVTDLVGWNIVVSPLRIKGADGSPARVWLYKVI
jgi:arylformamidase